MVLWLVLAALIRLISIDVAKSRKPCTCKRYPCACRTKIAGRSPS